MLDPKLHNDGSKYWQVVEIVDGEGNPQPAGGGEILTNNSTTDTLGIGATFTGTADIITNYGIIFISVYSDVASANEGLEIDQSIDGVNWYFHDHFTIPAATGKNFAINPHSKYLRIKYINGGSAQSVFQLQVIGKYINALDSSHRISESITTDDDARLVKSVTSAQTPDNGFVNITANRFGNFKVSLEESKDAFGRLRVSEPFTIFDSSLLTQASDTLFWNELTNGTGSSAFDVNTSKKTISTAASGDYVVRQTNQRFVYQPGKSHEVLITFLANTETNIIKRVGLVDYDNVGLATPDNTPQNGVFLENNAGTLSFNIVNNGVVTETVTQGNWNIDNLNGSDSSFIFDIESTNILFIDLEWLGVGAVRCGFVAPTGEIVVAHQFKHASNSFTDVYMRTANLPLSYSITQNAAGSGSLKCICGTVISEGGFNPKGASRAYTNETLQAVSSGDTELLVGIRLQENNFWFEIDPTFVSILSTSNANSLWYLCLNPTYAGSVTWNNLSNSVVQTADANNNLVSDLGVVIAAGSFSNNLDSLNEKIATTLRLGKKLDNSLDELWLIVKAIGNDSYYGSLNWIEYI